MLPKRFWSVVLCVVWLLWGARSDAAQEVQLLRVQAALSLGRTPTETLTFDILVKNLAYAKRVTLRLQSDAGVSTELDASFVRTVDSQSELWRASVRYFDPASASATYSCAVKYEVAGAVYWDDSDGKNYTLAVSGDGLLLLRPVLLDVASVRGAPSEVVGTVDVQSLAYAKKVTVVYSTDGWRTVQRQPAQYLAGPGRGNAEKWFFSIPAVTHFPIEFAIAYEVAGATYWDNNFGKNYELLGP